MTLRFHGVVKPLRRGGWSARGMIIAERHGQIVETQIGPREFAGRAAAKKWLRQAAAARPIEVVEILEGFARLVG